MTEFNAHASFSDRILFKNKILSASASATATSSISKQDAFKIAYNLCKKNVENNLLSQKLKNANSVPSNPNNIVNKTNLQPIANNHRVVSFRLNSGCGCGK